jgi:hypothetical protein
MILFKLEENIFNGDATYGKILLTQLLYNISILNVNYSTFLKQKY